MSYFLHHKLAVLDIGVSFIVLWGDCNSLSLGSIWIDWKEHSGDSFSSCSGCSWFLTPNSVTSHCRQLGCLTHKMYVPECWVGELH